MLLIGQLSNEDTAGECEMSQKGEKKNDTRHQLEFLFCSLKPLFQNGCRDAVMDFILSLISFFFFSPPVLPVGLPLV